MQELLNEETLNAIKTLAKGLVVKEITKEYSADENGELKLVKKKVNAKMLPPSVDVVKMIYSSNLDNQNKYKSMTDEELEQEKIRLLKELKEN